MINRQDIQITFHGSANPKISQHCTPATHTEAVDCHGVLLGPPSLSLTTKCSWIHLWGRSPSLSSARWRWYPQTWFSCLVLHPVRKRSRWILTTLEPARGSRQLSDASTPSLLVVIIVPCSRQKKTDWLARFITLWWNGWQLPDGKSDAETIAALCYTLSSNTTTVHKTECRLYKCHHPLTFGFSEVVQKFCCSEHRCVNFFPAVLSSASRSPANKR